MTQTFQDVEATSDSATEIIKCPITWEKPDWLSSKVNKVLAMKNVNKSHHAQELPLFSTSFAAFHLFNRISYYSAVIQYIKNIWHQKFGSLKHLGADYMPLEVFSPG